MVWRHEVCPAPTIAEQALPGSEFFIAISGFLTPPLLVLEQLMVEGSSLAKFCEPRVLRILPLYYAKPTT